MTTIIKIRTTGAGYICADTLQRVAPTGQKDELPKVSPVAGRFAIALYGNRLPVEGLLDVIEGNQTPSNAPYEAVLQKLRVEVEAVVRRRTEQLTKEFAGKPDKFETEKPRMSFFLMGFAEGILRVDWVHPNLKSAQLPLESGQTMINGVPYPAIYSPAATDSEIADFLKAQVSKISAEQPGQCGKRYTFVKVTLSGATASGPHSS